MKLSIVIPIYNEDKCIYDNVYRVYNTFKDKIDFEIICVNDGSTDRTFEELNKIKLKNLKIRNFGKNNGKGFAIKQGTKFASGDLVTFLDADLDLHPKQLFNFFEYIDNGADIVVGSKRHKKSRVDYPFHRVVLSWGFQLFIKFLFNLKVKDTQVGLKLFKRDCLNKILPKVAVIGFAYDLEMMVIAHINGYKVMEAPIILDYKKGGGNVGVRSIIDMFIDGFKIFYNKTFSNKYKNES